MLIPSLFLPKNESMGELNTHLSESYYGNVVQSQFGFNATTNSFEIVFVTKGKSKGILVVNESSLSYEYIDTEGTRRVIWSIHNQ